MSWRGRHEHLRLNTHRSFSHQPGRRMARHVGAYPGRDEYIAYLEEYAQPLRVRTGTEIRRVDPLDGGWSLSTSDAAALTTDHVVIATGPDIEPVMPTWPGADRFTGTMLHAGQFRRVDDVRGKDVLVVGPGNSGVDLLNHLVKSDAGKLWLSARSGMNIAPLRALGIPLHPIGLTGRYLPTRVQDANLRLLQRLSFGDLTRYGYPRSELGAMTRIRKDDVTIAIDDGFVKALKAGRVEMRPAIDRLEGAEVHFVDGRSCRPDVIICATGYRPGLEQLVGHLVELDHIGMPPFRSPHAIGDRPGLWFFGFKRSPYGNMHIRRREARQLARLIAGTTPLRPPPGDRDDRSPATR
jgi:cation diffusion facilitator CzcD-associated flavoprotein CzcO